MHDLCIILSQRQKMKIRAIHFFLFVITIIIRACKLCHSILFSFLNISLNDRNKHVGHMSAACKLSEI